MSLWWYVILIQCACGLLVQPAQPTASKPPSEPPLGVQVAPGGAWVAKVADVSVGLYDLKTECMVDGRTGRLINSVTVHFEVGCPAKGPAIAAPRLCSLSEFRDEAGVDLLAPLGPATMDLLHGFDWSPFDKSYKVRGPDGAPVFRKTPVFYGRDLAHAPRSISRMSGTMVVLRPKTIREFDLKTPEQADGSGRLQELVPGLWATIDRRKVGAEEQMHLFAWLCNSVPREFEKNPERFTLGGLEAVRPRRRQPGEPVGHDPTRPPAIVGILVTDPAGAAMSDSPLFETREVAVRSSGVYLTSSFGEWRQKKDDPIPSLRLLIATELEQIEVPFDFRDIPLSYTPPAKP